MRGKGGGINLEFGINIYTQLYMKQGPNLLYNTGDDIQYLRIIYNEKQSDQEYTHVHIYV